MRNDSTNDRQRFSPQLLPRFFRTNNAMSSFLLPSESQVNGMATHRRECLVLPPKDTARCQTIRKNCLYQLLYEQQAHLPQPPHRGGIVTIDFDDSSNQRLVRYVKREIHQVQIKKRESRSTTHQQQSSRLPSYDASALAKRLLNQKQLTAKKKYIDVGVSSAAYERERFRELILKEKEQRKLRRQKSIENSYVNPKTLHERVRQKKRKYPSFWADDSLQLTHTHQHDGKGHKRYTSHHEDIVNLRPWTNSLAQAEADEHCT